MATTNITLCGDEDYIDMELISSPKNREFEFQMTSTCNEKETTTSSADELFFNGKLLPLHITATTAAARITKEGFRRDHYYKMPFTAPCTNANTPLDSCNISPSESCRASCELNPDDYFFQWSTELTQLNTFINNHPTKKPWSKKLKLIKHSILGQKLQASKTYLKSLFRKSACSDESSAYPNYNAEAEKAEILPKESSFSKIAKKRPFSYPTTGAIMKNSTDNEGIEDNVQRRSFSGAIKRHSPVKCLSSSISSSDASSSSSSFSFTSNGSHELQLLRRRSSATEIEGLKIIRSIPKRRRLMRSWADLLFSLQSSLCDDL